MEPKVSMSWFVVALVAGLLALSLAGHSLAALWVAVGVAALAALQHAIYMIGRRAAKRMPKQFRERRGQRLVPVHRSNLDRWTAGQWAALALLAGAGSAVIHSQAWRPFAHVGMVFTVLLVGWIVLWAGVYLSATVDWYLIMPKVSGISCPAPCERPGKQRWAGVTGLWAFHRGFARLLVPFVLIGSATVIGALTHSSAGRAIAFSIAATLALYLAQFELEGKAAMDYGLNARRYLGDRVWLVRESETGVTRAPAYLLDVSAEGAKFKYLDEHGAYPGEPFENKHDDDGDPVTLTALNKRWRVSHASAPCAERCTGVNWYCWRNPLAHSQTTSAGDET